jgi:uncharacterized protein YdcH (DUF465 family)
MNTKTTKTTKAKTSTASAPKTRTTTHHGHEYDPTETNWAALTFPADPFGLSSKLRREFRDAVNRCKGSDDKFQHLLDNLEVLQAWAEAKLEADKQANARAAEMAASRAAEESRKEEFRSRIQAGPSIRVSATATGFIETSRRDGSILAVYDTAEDEQGPVASMAQMMIAEGRSPTSTLQIDAFGRPGIGSGRTLADLAASAGTEATAEAAPGGLQGIKT